MIIATFQIMYYPDLRSRQLKGYDDSCGRDDSGFHLCPV